MSNKPTENWEKEYLSQGIPSSYRTDPAKVIVNFMTFLEEMGFRGQEALDLGCGKGRNAFYLAEHGYHVTGIDLVAGNIAEINRTAHERGLAVEGFCQSVTEPWPLQGQVDVAIDIFCYKHIVNKQGQRAYRHYLAAALKDNGFYFLSLAADDDGFYGPLLAGSPDPIHKLVIDPFANIASYLYSLDEITQEFSDTFKLVKASKVQSVSPMHGKEYQRQVLNLIFQKL